MVNKDVKDYALVVGNPAKQIGWACQCGERLTDELSCTDCKKDYVSTKNGLKEIS